MCIRDRAYDAVKSMSDIQFWTGEGECQSALGVQWTVSYTHLDVYKRQRIGWEGLPERKRVRRPACKVCNLQFRGDVYKRQVQYVLSP